MAEVKYCSLCGYPYIELADFINHKEIMCKAMR